MRGVLRSIKRHPAPLVAAALAPLAAVDAIHHPVDGGVVGPVPDLLVVALVLTEFAALAAVDTRPRGAIAAASGAFSLLVATGHWTNLGGLAVLVGVGVASCVGGRRAAAIALPAGPSRWSLRPRSCRAR